MTRRFYYFIKLFVILNDIFVLFSPGNIPFYVLHWPPFHSLLLRLHFLMLDFNCIPADKSLKKQDGHIGGDVNKVLFSHTSKDNM